MFTIQVFLPHNGFVLYQTQCLFDALELADILQKNNPLNVVYVYDENHKKVN